MVAVLLPAGHFAGEFYTMSGAETPEYYEVRLGSEIFRLDPETYAVWAFAHGDPQALASGAELNRLSVNAMAREAGLGDISRPLADLQNQGLLLQVLPVGPRLQQFAEGYRVRSLSLGLGNTAEDVQLLRVGHPDQYRLSVPPLIYTVWLYADYYSSLWETCVELAPQMTTERTTLSPSDVLGEFFAVLPLLISVSCAYIDRR